MKTEPSAKRYLCLWLPEPLPAADSEQPGTHRQHNERKKMESERLKAFALWCQQFSPRVAIEREPGERGLRGSTLVLEITGLGPHFGGERGLVKEIAQQLCKRNVVAHLGIADSIGAAWALAHFGHPSTICPNDFIEEESPITLHFLPPQLSLLDALHALPVAALRLNTPTVELLVSLGIHSVGQLSALPRQQLSARFGKEILSRIDQTAGTLDEVLRVIPPAEPVAAEWIFEFPTADRSVLKNIFRQLIDRLQLLLTSQSRIPLEIACRLKLQDRTEERFTVSLYHACGDVPHLAELLELRLERTTFSAPVSGVFLMVTEVANEEHHQPSWFDVDLREKSENRVRGDRLPKNPFMAPLHRCLERLRSRLGPGAVVQPRWTQDAIPERAIRFSPRVKSAHAPKNNPSRKTIALRPLWLQPHPQRLHVFSRDQHDLPVTFSCLGDRHTIIRLEGPERIESSWHGRQPPRHILRDYYRAETSTLRRFWLFRRHQDSAWFLHGEFD
jgi:protein ImuB